MCTARYIRIQNQPKSQFECVPRDTENIEFLILTSWLKSPHHSGFWFAFRRAFRVSSSFERAYSRLQIGWHRILRLSPKLSVWPKSCQNITNSMGHRNITNSTSHSNVANSTSHSNVANSTSHLHHTNSACHLNITNSMGHLNITDPTIEFVRL